MSERLDFQLRFDSDQLRPIQVERAMLSFEKEITELDGVEKPSGRPIGKDLDPLTFAALTISLAPTMITKFFEFLNAWAMRRENRMIKIKIQIDRNTCIEFEGSETLSPKKIEDMLTTIRKTLKRK
jgi:hypothetical protein